MSEKGEVFSKGVMKKKTLRFLIKDERWKGFFVSEQKERENALIFAPKAILLWQEEEYCGLSHIYYPYSLERNI